MYSLAAASLASRATCVLQGRPLPMVQAVAGKSTRSRTHYDVLDVPPTATQGEIKSAYYKQTLKYHPDRNNSKEARGRFQAISDAYEVLGNDESRKQYDVSMRLQRKTPRSPRHDPIMEELKRQAAAARPAVTFNFDEWARQHYSEMYDRSKRRRELFLVRKRENRERMRQAAQPISKLEMACCAAFMAVFLAQLFALLYGGEKGRTVMNV